MKKPKHGGKRIGAGRPKPPPELKKEETITMRIPKSKDSLCNWVHTFFMETTLVIIPNEVQQLAAKVTAEKQQEVSNVLNQIFTGTADWENQVDLT